MNVYLSSLGCRVNQSEIETLTRRLAAAGHTIVRDPTQAHICILNTCAVTAEAERKTRHMVRYLARTNPQAQIALIGCYVTLRPRESADLPVKWIIPNDQKVHVVEIATGENEENGTTHSPFAAIAGMRTRACVKVQDGCDHHCTYCIVRSLRGPSRSRPVADVVAEIQSLVAAGYCEVVLTGVNLGAYGHDLATQDDLVTLIVALLADTDLPRLRLSSLEAWDIGLDRDGMRLFRLWENARLCRQLHLPLQSGCDRILQRMGRRVTTGDFARIAATARAAIPGLALTTDIIVGFPGEDGGAFRASYDFVAEMAFARLHVFPYSPRPGTPATRLPDPVPAAVLAQRAQAMRDLGTKLSEQFRRQFIGQTLEVLWERQKGTIWSGWSDNYLKVVTHSSLSISLHNRITPTHILCAENAHLVGKVCNPVGVPTDD